MWTLLACQLLQDRNKKYPQIPKTLELAVNWECFGFALLFIQAKVNIRNIATFQCFLVSTSLPSVNPFVFQLQGKDSTKVIIKKLIEYGGASLEDFVSCRNNYKLTFLMT